MQRRVFAFAALALIALGIAGCSENLTSGAACPSLCPQEQVVLNDTILDAVSLDTTVGTYPTSGNEPILPIVLRGDTLETRVIVRFDTLPTTWTTAGVTGDSAIARVDSAYVQARIRYPVSDSTTTFTIDAYNVDTTITDASDTTLAAVAPLFRPDRLLGSLAFTATSVKDSLLRVPISNAFVLDRIKANGRVRVGFRVRAGQNGAVSIYSRESGITPTLSFRVSPDTAQKRVSALSTSSTPTEPAFQRAPFADYLLIVRGQASIFPPASIGVGGLPGRRGFLRFVIPARILDSSTVVRATLLMTQRPNRAVPDQRDTLTVYPLAVVAAEAVTEIARAAEFLAEPGSFGLDSLKLVPADSGLRSIEVAGLLAQWHAAQVPANERALVFKSLDEGTRPGAILFYSIEAPQAVRPRLRVTFATRVPFGLP